MTPSPRPRRPQRPVVYALYLNAALLLAILVALLSRGGGDGASPSWLPGLPAAFAANPQPPQPIAGGGGIFLMPAQFSVNTFGCYVMDIDAQTLCAYQFYPGEKQLRFVAARSFRFDRRLENFNTIPAPREVEQLLNVQRNPARQNNPDAPAAPRGEGAEGPTPVE